jgi:hypothetical protein
MSQPSAGNLIQGVTDSEMEQRLTLREALAEDRLAEFVRQEEGRGVELANGSELRASPSHYEAPPAAIGLLGLPLSGFLPATALP